MDEDKEIQAIVAVNTALKGLTEEERFRVIQWLANKYVTNQTPVQLTPRPVAGNAILPDAVEDGDEADKSEEQAFETFADMLDVSGADKPADRALVAAYWIQVVLGEASWKTSQLNAILKETGHFIERMDSASKSLLESKPAKAIQVAKASTASGLGHKTLKLTTHGVKEAKKMIIKETA